MKEHDGFPWEAPDYKPAPVAGEPPAPKATPAERREADRILGVPLWAHVDIGFEDDGCLLYDVGSLGTFLWNVSEADRRLLTTIKAVQLIDGVISVGLARRPTHRERSLLVRLGGDLCERGVYDTRIHLASTCDALWRTNPI